MKNKIKKCKSYNFPGGLSQEAQSINAWKDGLLGAKEKKIFLRSFYGQLLWCSVDVYLCREYNINNNTTISTLDSRVSVDFSNK